MITIATFLLKAVFFTAVCFLSIVGGVFMYKHSVNTEECTCCNPTCSCSGLQKLLDFKQN